MPPDSPTPSLSTFLTSSDEIQGLQNVESILLGQCWPNVVFHIAVVALPQPVTILQVLRVSAHPPFSPWINLFTCSFCPGATSPLLTVAPWQACWFSTFRALPGPPLGARGNIWIPLCQAGAEGEVALPCVWVSPLFWLLLFKEELSEWWSLRVLESKDVQSSLLPILP